MRNLRHITSINDLSTEEIEGIFARADFYLQKLRDEKAPYRIARSLNELPGAILAGLFYEPSTRTRLSFESAMLRLGGKAMASADPRTSSASKGESLADTVRVTSSYADVLVVRHPRDGAARLAASYAPVPVINGGDGSHEHPTQTLLDLFTLRRKKKALRNLNVAISGDLKASRTIHSFVYALARFGANIVLKPAPGMELPDDVAWRLENEFHRERTSDAQTGEVWYVTPGRQTRRRSIDAVYVTRFQSERWSNAAGAYPTVNAEFLRKKEFRTTAVMHPLPRVNELDLSLDQDRRAAYFEQAAYGVPIRMAIISALLASRAKKTMKRYPDGFPRGHEPLYEAAATSGVMCINSNCIVHDSVEAPYAARKFHLVGAEPPRLRCFYCETDIDTFWIADARSATVFANDEQPLDWSRKYVPDLRFYATPEESAQSGFPRRGTERTPEPMKRRASSRLRG
ncbi:MAG TPA: aspartate carbamoyltransferase [Rhizomicrobium sp.]|nr:aspartate carbamoyltransferase [Rhizomicrobium sp.]